MSSDALDDIDRGILYALQREARGSTTTELGLRLDVSASTVSNRIDRLEADGIITGYRATVDYERAGFPLHVLMICTAPIGERGDIARRVLDIPGVVNVRELMVGENNIQVEVVGESNDEILIRNQYFRPLKQFHPNEE